MRPNPYGPWMDEELRERLTDDVATDPIRVTALVAELIMLRDLAAQLHRVRRDPSCQVPVLMWATLELATKVSAAVDVDSQVAIVKAAKGWR